MAREDGWFEKILGVLHQHSGVDFTNYKPATLHRRIKRRMNARKIRSFKDYCQYLRLHRHELKDLFNDVLIQVTSFFRDPLVFKALKTKYFPQIIREKHPEDPIRIWVPACSTGEELYSLAILLAELTEAKNLRAELQIFGTDINELALQKARAGIYQPTIKKDVSPDRLQRFFEPVKGGFAIRKHIRDMCIFARHNLAVDPPFSNMDLISCRNAFIYMTPALQAKIMGSFHFALKPTGLLLLGPSETTGSSSALFVSADRKLNLFQKKGGNLKNLSEASLPPASSRNPARMSARLAVSAHSKKVEPAQIRAAVERIIQRNAEAENVESQVVPITLPNTQEKAYLVIGAPPRTGKPGKKTAGAKKPEVENARLRKELFQVRETVDLIIEQQEATNEELRAANEEIVSSNEELQSTNEELETAQEELQASNEELATLNGELENRNLELEKANVIASHYKAIVDSSDDAIISKDLHGTIQTWNKAAEKIFGYTADEVIGKSVTILMPPENREEEPEILARIRAGERIDHYETIRKRKDGRLLDISLTVSPIKNSFGQVIGASKIARDITEKKRAARLAKYFEAIVTSSDDAIVSKDLNGIIQTWNKGAERMFGYTADEVIGKPVTILFPPENLNEEPKILARLRAGERIEHYETVRVRKDGQLLDVSLLVSPIKDDTGRVIGGSKIARDITERKRAELEIKKARNEAEEASRAKDNFLAALSHELRTPLNPVLLVASDAIRDPDLPPGVRANFDIILKNVELEAKLIDDLLDLVRVRTGKLKVEKRHVNVYSVLSAAIAIVQNEIDQKKINLVQKFQDTHSIILGDAVRLQQVFWNVLKNAIKFTPLEGEITIETSSTPETCLVKISDTGIGMSQNELARVFDAFKQGDHSFEAQKFGGLGLGLTISKNLVILHGGTIKASSEGSGKGSSFTMTFPLAMEKSRDIKPGSPSDPKGLPTKASGLRVLLVEDHEPTRATLTKLLANRLHKVTVAGSVGEAVALVKQSNFDLVISDIGLPDGTGYEVFKAALKHSPATKGIALTGYGMDKDLATSKESGFSLHLTKPVRIDALDTALSDVLKERS
jgi:two-component system, chemotaxis family, CheB/CheR fusion protein